MPFSGALPLTPPTFLKKVGQKTLNLVQCENRCSHIPLSCGRAGACSRRYNKIETRGTDEVSASFYLALTAPTQRAESCLTVFINTLQEVFWRYLFFKKGNKNASYASYASYAYKQKNRSINRAIFLAKYKERMRKNKHFSDTNGRPSRAVCFQTRVTRECVTLERKC